MNILNVFDLIKKTLINNNVDIDGIVTELGQVLKENTRNEGKYYSLQEHTEAMILAILSARTKWKKIQNNLGEIKRIFGEYDTYYITSKQGRWFADKLKEIKCRNQVVYSQMDNVVANIKVFDRIIKDYGDMEEFVISRKPLEIARLLSVSGSKYKLGSFGIATACEYMRNVGFSLVKPDKHIMTITGRGRLNLLEDVRDEFAAAALLSKMAEEGGLSATYFDNVIWMFGASEYGEICSANPKCGLCLLRNICNFGK